MALGIILAIIIAGLILIFVEMLVVPGTHLFAIAGGIAIIVGVALMYNYYGSKWGNISAFASLVGFAVALLLGVRVIQSNKLAMKAEIKSQVNLLEKHLFNLGDKGLTDTELRPQGKATINGAKLDVYSTGDYVQRGSEVEIVKITNDKIFVTLSKT